MSAMYMIRLLVVGDTGVGKTSLLMRFHEDTFVYAQKATIGVDYKAKEVNINGELVKLQIWDTAGQERFRSVNAAFYNRAHGAVITFDVGQRSSFEALTSWIKEIREVRLFLRFLLLLAVLLLTCIHLCAANPPPRSCLLSSIACQKTAPESCVMMLCANKVDLPVEKREVKREEYMKFAEAMGLDIMECSASTGQNVNAMFEELGRQVLGGDRTHLTQLREEVSGHNDKSIILAEFTDRQRRQKKERPCCSRS